MGEIVAVLVVPSAGDPAGLLRGGPCGSMPPMVMPPDPEWERKELIPECGHWQTHSVRGWPAFEGCALPLWWDGSIVPEGWDRARRVYSDNGWDPRGYDGEAVDDPDPNLRVALSLAEGLVAGECAACVVRLTRDASGALVEVT